MSNLNQYYTMKKNWFTLVEIILILVIISTTLITILSWVQKASSYISQIRQKTIALNLAKEWIEIMYNIRDTNRRRRSNNRDKCWLKINPFTEDEDGNRRTPWRWILRDENWSFYWEKIETLADNILSTEEELTNNHQALINRISTNSELSNYKIYYDPSSGYWTQNEWTENAEANLWTGTYYRYITIDGLYKKSNNQKLNCENGNQNNCWDSSAKELRFCSIVTYTYPHLWRAHICAIMTNFLE